MARFYCLIFLLIPTLAFADFPASVKYKAYSGQIADTLVAACATNVGASFGGGTINSANYNGSNCLNYPNFGGVYYLESQPIYTCPSGSPDASNNCAGAPPNDCSLTGQISALNNNKTVNVTDAQDSANTACISGCQFTLAKQSVSVGTTENGVTLFSRTTGHIVTDAPASACSGTSAIAPLTNAQIQAKECSSKGAAVGVINGISLCVPISTPNASPVKNNAVKQNIGSDGNVTTTTNNYTTNNDGTVTTTTTTTITNSSGGLVGTPTTTTAKQDTPSFCEQNPNLQICKQSSFGGSCGGYVCNGDAIQCAIAQRAYKDRCEADDAKEVITARGTYATGQKLENGDYTDDVKGFLNKSGTNSRSVNVATSLSETGSASYSSDGFQDVRISVLGKNLSVPISSANYYFNIFGYILLGLTYLSAYKYIASVV